MHALDPDHMTAAGRLAELGNLLAAGLMRLRARKSTQESADFRKSLLALSRQQRGHAEAAARAVP
jgi:hypothetical protein